MQGYFSGLTDKPFVVDKSREWGVNYGLLNMIFPNPKIICMVRDLRCIFSSMEKNFRKNPIYTQDATKIDYNKFLSELNLGTDIDYLQLDCDPPSVTYDILTKIPFDKYRFAVITFEHDYYADITKSYRDKSREFLFSKGYILIASNIAPDSTSSFEDWWVHPELISKDIINIMIDNGGNVKNAQEYMLNKKIK
jgi:hypothetical protein